VADLRRLQRALYHRQVELRRLSDGPLERHAPIDVAPPTEQMPEERRLFGWVPWLR
jgi:hypothetical protein